MLVMLLIGVLWYAPIAAGAAGAVGLGAAPPFLWAMLPPVVAPILEQHRARHPLPAWNFIAYRAWRHLGEPWHWPQPIRDFAPPGLHPRGPAARGPQLPRRLHRHATCGSGLAAGGGARLYADHALRPLPRRYLKLDHADQPRPHGRRGSPHRADVTAARLTGEWGARQFAALQRQLAALDLAGVHRVLIATDALEALDLSAAWALRDFVRRAAAGGDRSGLSRPSRPISCACSMTP